MLKKLIYKRFIKPVLFLQDPEKVHDRATKLASLFGKWQISKTITKNLFHYENKALKQKILGITFKNPIGLSAGFDKNGDMIDIVPHLGFGFTQVGTITDQAYEGNPRPRLYRLPKSKALIVYFGLKNIGATKILPKIPKKPKIPVSISIGKTNCTATSSTEAGIKDYCACIRKSIKSGKGDFYTINISCPNTFGGEPFTTPTKLDTLLKAICKTRPSKPVFLKMPINKSWPQFKKLLDVATKNKIDGVIIGNLNKNFQDKTIKDHIPKHLKGGISGLPTKELCNNLISKTYKYCGNKLTIIGVGGIFSAQDAYHKIKLGASLLQLITGMIYEGPQLISQINKELVTLLKKDGHKNISQAIGSFHQM